MMKPEVKLRATEEVINDLLRFTDTEIARDLLDLFEFRLFEQHGLISENEKFVGYDHESDFIYWELNALSELLGKLLYDSEDMVQELNFLYYSCSVGYYKQVEQQLIAYAKKLDELYKDEDSIINEVIRKGSLKIRIIYKGGQKRVKQYKVNLAILVTRLYLPN